MTSNYSIPNDSSTRCSTSQADDKCCLFPILIERINALELHNQDSPTVSPAIPVPVTRRNWLKRSLAGIAGSVAAVGVYACGIEPHWVEVVRRKLPIVNLPGSLVGKTVVQISDIHIGDRVDDEYLIHWFRRVTEWQPDIVVFTGDFLTLRSDRSLPVDAMQRVLRQFPQGKLATVGVLGNHDYGANWNDRNAANVVQSLANEAGIQILRNETREVSGLQIVGFDDYWGTNFRGRDVLRGKDLGLPTLVLCHNPDVVDLPIWWDYRGWILSGHTHGGQCKAPFVTPPRLPIRNTRYAAGEVTLEDGRRLYVNRALGHSLQIRFNVRPEITIFELGSEHSCESHVGLGTESLGVGSIPAVFQTTLHTLS